jgi:hypothetical protein
MSSEASGGRRQRLRHDCAHGTALRLLGIVAPALRGEEQQEFYREAMPVLMAGLADYDRKRAREEQRLAVRSRGDEAVA